MPRACYVSYGIQRTSDLVWIVCDFFLFAPLLAGVQTSKCPSYGLREKTLVWKSGRSVAETRTRSTFWVYMTNRDLVMAIRNS
jgi:hypothetical protein